LYLILKKKWYIFWYRIRYRSKKFAVLNTGIQYRSDFFRYWIPVLSTALFFPGTEYRYWIPLWFFPGTEYRYWIPLWFFPVFAVFNTGILIPVSVPGKKLFYFFELLNLSCSMFFSYILLCKIYVTAAAITDFPILISLFIIIFPCKTRE
jgi:hypothetical protein